MSDLTSTLEGLRDGTVTTDDAVSRLTARQWPIRLAHEPAVTQGDNLAADVADGSFGEVAAAFAAGWITDAQYLALAEAYGNAMNRAAAPFPKIPDTDDFADADGDMDGDSFDWETAPDIPGARQEDLFDTGESKVLPPLSAGAYVKTPDGGRGRIKMVDGGSATVTVWAKGDKGWTATGKTVTVALAKLTRVPPLHAGATKAADAEHEVYRRGVQAWTPDTKTTPHSWATGRVDAFRRRAAGETVPGYTRDDDLL